MRTPSLLSAIVLAAGTVDAWVHLDPSIIPHIPTPLPLLTLGPPSTFPTTLLNELINESHPSHHSVELKPNKTMGPGLYAHLDDRLVGYVDPETGEAHIYPNLARITPVPANETYEGRFDVTEAVWSLLGMKEAFPEDDTTLNVVHDGSLVGSSVFAPGQYHQNGSHAVAAYSDVEGREEVYWTNGVIERSITFEGQTYPVCGPGSHATFSVGPSQQVYSLSYTWRPAHFAFSATGHAGGGKHHSFKAHNGSAHTNLQPQPQTPHFITPKSAHDIKGQIKHQLQSTGRKTSLVKVEEVDVCYYDGNKGYMQPVYRFFGRTHASEGRGKAPGMGPKKQGKDGGAVTEPVYVVGYVPIGDGSPEKVPTVEETSIGDGKGEEPIENWADKKNKGSKGKRQESEGLNYFQAASQKLSSFAPRSSDEDDLDPRAISLPSIRVGRYVVRNDIPEWTASARSFLSSLNSHRRLATWDNTHFYWSRPFLYTTSKDQFINNVDIALTEAHGSFHLFTTDANCCDIVDVEDDIPAGGLNGYGASSTATKKQGLSYWVIHSCEVLPTSYDFPSASSPAEARRLAYAPWWDVFNGLHAVLSYRTQMYIQDHATAEFGRSVALGVPVVEAWMKAVSGDRIYRGRKTYYSRNAGRDQPFGRASAVFVCGHEGDRVWDREDLGRPGCLRMVWYEN
ncbi:hypothetical protein CC1G_04667 [Coprinopsis cinerea okayama7|uniref:Uncharacterized protein n=1 Tax=Coprinopsis cinerea (strain Okayama-7 / 130 / ATCC MYA-4618 / FGSC 9003) TaxID=240176 RepID=A8N560_COPC7|nr:hypothetical protein CC1G_04667 [Coprinopsis cinerea okayama7\|eukprot:XP_001829978.1 hypothetical protein CC1G_04667 [Coprinopsis cinerea okayama7\